MKSGNSLQNKSNENVEEIGDYSDLKKEINHVLNICKGITNTLNRNTNQVLQSGDELKLAKNSAPNQANLPNVSLEKVAQDISFILKDLKGQVDISDKNRSLSILLPQFETSYDSGFKYAEREILFQNTPCKKLDPVKDFPIAELTGLISIESKLSVSDSDSKDIMQKNKTKKRLNTNSKLKAALTKENNQDKIKLTKNSLVPPTSKLVPNSGQAKPNHDQAKPNSDQVKQKLQNNNPIPLTKSAEENKRVNMAILKTAVDDYLKKVDTNDYYSAINDMFPTTSPQENVNVDKIDLESKTYKKTVDKLKLLNISDDNIVNSSFANTSRKTNNTSVPNNKLVDNSLVPLNKPNEDDRFRMMPNYDSSVFNSTILNSIDDKDKQSWFYNFPNNNYMVPLSNQSKIDYVKTKLKNIHLLHEYMKLAVQSVENQYEEKLNSERIQYKTMFSSNKTPSLRPPTQGTSSSNNQSPKAGTKPKPKRKGKKSKTIATQTGPKRANTISHSPDKPTVHKSKENNRNDKANVSDAKSNIFDKKYTNLLENILEMSAKSALSNNKTNATPRSSKSISRSSSRHKSTSKKTLITERKSRPGLCSIKTSTTSNNKSNSRPNSARSNSLDLSISTNLKTPILPRKSKSVLSTAKGNAKSKTTKSGSRSNSYDKCNTLNATVTGPKGGTKCKKGSRGGNSKNSYTQTNTKPKCDKKSKTIANCNTSTSNNSFTQSRSKSVPSGPSEEYSKSKGSNTLNVEVTGNKCHLFTKGTKSEPNVKAEMNCECAGNNKNNLAQTRSKFVQRARSAENLKVEANIDKLEVSGDKCPLIQRRIKSAPNIKAKLKNVFDSTHKSVGNNTVIETRTMCTQTEPKSARGSKLKTSRTDVKFAPKLEVTGNKCNLRQRTYSSSLDSERKTARSNYRTRLNSNNSTSNNSFPQSAHKSSTSRSSRQINDSVNLEMIGDKFALNKRSR